jgi:retron-type reverse transcriptase
MDLVTIDVPKKDFTLRPGAVPEIIDRIYYQALCNAIAPTIEANLTPYEEKVLFSYRLNKNVREKYMFIDPHEAYSEFVSYQNELCESQEFSMVLETDIADYFQRIYHHELFNLLAGFKCDEDILICLTSLLRKWRKGISYGIPQSMWPSHLLGNVYLHELDRIMSDKYTYLRYVDDIIIFCQNEVDAKSALMEICKLIRNLGLNVQSAKTRIRDKESFSSRIRPFSEKINEFSQLPHPKGWGL